jgi:hypothetical protein
VAHWLAWCCSMTPGVAREHVRVAKALATDADRLPACFGRVVFLFEGAGGHRVVDVVDEHAARRSGVDATASQLARMIAGFRSADGMRIGSAGETDLSWHEREDGMIDFRARLPKEEAALAAGAIEAAKDQFGPPPAKPDPCGEESDGRRMLLGTAMRMPCVMWPQGVLDTAPEDRSGEDRSSGGGTGVGGEPGQKRSCGNAGSPSGRCGSGRKRSRGNVFTGVRRSVTLTGSGSIEPATAQRLPARVRCWVR